MIEVVSYDPQWPLVAAALIGRYRHALEGVPVIAIEHVGSTSVPGLAAKPVLDIDILVAEADVDAASATLEALGYEPLGDQGIEHRWAFRAPRDVPRTNTYVVVDGSVAARNHLGVRDLLRADPILREEYGNLKRRLAATVEDMAGYVEAKSELLARILRLAGLSETEVSEIQAANRADPSAGG